MQDFFYGWYLKCQSATQTLAVIPAVHQTKEERTCSIQIITEKDTWTVTFPANAFQRTGKNMQIGENQFCKKGIRLAINTPDLSLKGKLCFGSLSPLKYDIMGPFAIVPFMECRHFVWSMRHLVCGRINLNGQKYVFENDLGYWEGDCGYSFPKSYVWTQCFLPNGSLMLSVADIPMAGIHFTGIIGVVLWKGQEYRLATYLGAKVIQIKNKMLRIVQGNMELEVRLLEETAKPLKAPDQGAMVRTIHENASCRAFYQFRKGSRILFSLESNRASFEYEYYSCTDSISM